MYYVYVHTVPNGKMYVGKARDIRTRWNGGEGYAENPEFYKDIKAYGWENIKHEIISECIDNYNATVLESVLIALLKTENKSYGYNQTEIYKNAMKKYAERVSIDTPGTRPYEKSGTFFEQFGLPRSACENIIDEWIFSEEHRKIAKDRLLNDMSLADLVVKYNKADRTIKNIIRTVCDKLEQHL